MITTELELQDTYFLQLGPLTSLEGSIFSIDANTIRPYEWPDDIHVTVSFEFNLNYFRIDRETYNTLDWLGDLGGLKEALLYMLGLLYGLIYFRSFEDYLVSKLFRPSCKQEEVSQMYNSMGKSTGKGSSILDPGKMNCFLKRFYELGICKKTCNCGRSRRYRLFKEGREKLSEEIDVVRLLQKVR